ncbi:MAG TPA: hypothetical protein VFV87_21915 [Pirellulaceae bacterium]|nr:hypothetical protein [Pirellulaceae bacterium]
MTSRLATLRSQLAGLRRARASARAATAWSALGVAILWALAGLFLLDVIFELPVFQRLVLMVLVAGGVAWAFWRFTRPLLGWKESEIEMALLVERQQEIDSDLVAALQFEGPEAKRWGSPQLESAVIEYVAAVGRGINVFEGFSREQMLRRGGLLAASLAVVLIAAIIAPQHLAVFGNRLLLGSQHYPTSTVIEQIAINEKPVLAGPSIGELPGQSGMRPASLKAAEGRQIRFTITAAGDTSPKTGTVRLQSAGKGRSRTSFELKRQGDSKLYAGELPRLLEDVNYQVYLGDAWTDPARLSMVPLPIVETQLTPIFPRYAQSGRDSFDPTGRQVAVLEGTSIQLAIECQNKKRLQSAWLTIKAGESQQKYDLAKTDSDGFRWRLAEENSPLANIHQELRYELQVLDEDNLGLESPIRGTIRIRPDRPPSGVADVVHKVVLPTAQPLVEYRAMDDYGIAGLALVVEVERAASPGRGRESIATTGTGDGPSSPQLTPDPLHAGGGSAVAPDSTPSDMTPAAALPVERRRFDVLKRPEPLTGTQLPLSGQFALALSPLGLVKGDRIKIVLEVTDYRGENDAGEPAGLAYQSDPLVLEISDESGVLAAISEADQRSEERLTDIIKRQLGIGESP